MPFPDILKELREKKGFTQEQLAAYFIYRKMPFHIMKKE